jgi:hypothetical protein
MEIAACDAHKEEIRQMANTPREGWKDFIKGVLF